MEGASLREQLRRLGIGRGTAQLKPRSQHRGRSIEELLPGQVVNTGQGSFFLHRETYESGYRHGHHVLADLLACTLELPALLVRDERLAVVDLDHIGFIDTETTGLAGGTGTYAFLVGVGVFEAERFTVHQFFMRDYDEEPAQLYALGELLDRLEAVVSFNGKSFDLPLLETRFVMNRQTPRLTDAPHLDLLPAARRFWKYRLDSCALSSIEAEVLGVRRTQEDVAGWLIPRLYMDYTRSGDAREMPHVFYHNAQDILSLVTMMLLMCELLSVPNPADHGMLGEDLYGMGRIFHEWDLLERAEIAYAQAAQTCLSVHVREMAMRDLAYLLKRQGRRVEALPWWQRLVEAGDAVYACEELAKHYEWHDEDLLQALAWTRRGIALTEKWPPNPKRHETLASLENRLDRLTRKSRMVEGRCDEAPG